MVDARASESHKPTDSTHRAEAESKSSATNSQSSSEVPNVLYARSDPCMEQQDKDAVASVDSESVAIPTPDSAKDQESKTDSEKKGQEPEPSKKSKCRHAKHKHSKPDKKHVKPKSSKHTVDSNDDSDSESESDSSSSTSEDSSSESEEDEPKKKKSKSKKAKKPKKTEKKKVKKAKRSSKSKHASDSSETEESESETESDTEESETSSSDESTEEDVKRKRKPRKVKAVKKSRKAKHRKAKAVTDPEDEADEGSSSNADEDPTITALKQQLAELETKLSAPKNKTKPKSSTKASSKSASKEQRKTSKKSDSPHFKRVDEIWDRHTHCFKLKESAEEDESEFAEYSFLVRRHFDWENKYLNTTIDIKSKHLRSALQTVMKDCKAVSLEAEEPSIDPNKLFVYLEELRKYYTKTLKSKIKKEKKRKVRKGLKMQKTLLKTLVGYIDQDYASTKKTLYPLLEAGNITFDLLWALFHPGDIAVTSCYGVWDEPRCFKMEYATKCASMSRGQWYSFEGKYLEYDGKNFGFSDFEVEVDHFQGPRKITSLATYPLKYHKEPEKVKKQICDRGERFVNMEGMHYKFHKGLAFMKKKRQIIKININGRVMADPATFRRINPNYPIAWIKPREAEELFGCDTDSDSDAEDCCCEEEHEDQRLEGQGAPKYKYKWTADEKGRPCFVAVEVDENGDPIKRQRVEGLEQDTELRKRRFTREELLLTSPVVLGFAFSEKLWLEFTISGMNEISWNEKAYDSLVLPPNQKDIVRALVESHKTNGAKTIDDVVQGKGKGLVSVLHGPPGTGKTLTAEGISELLKCPLYMVSVGELGTNPSNLEVELQKILDIAHGWGAVLLLDEADVFLEKRQVQDVHRNALVSIFLRLLEYFQGILFLTTNRVETFDDAFQSRIHVALRYGALTGPAKKTVWQMFIKRVADVDGMEVEELDDHQYNALSRHDLNGRQIKNMVRTAQALALHEKKKLTMEHINRVLDVAQTFEQDLKGGTGYIEAMRSYT